jgi:hypothetical protein
LNDLKELGDYEYGLPTIVNFPGIDGIFMTEKPIYLIRVTLSEKRDVTKDLEGLFLILEEIQRGREIVMIWVVDSANILKFTPEKAFSEFGIQNWKQQRIS